MGHKAAEEYWWATRAKIRKLRDEARHAGDVLQVRLCDKALRATTPRGGPWRACADVISTAEAQNDDPQLAK